MTDRVEQKKAWWLKQAFLPIKKKFLILEQLQKHAKMFRVLRKRLKFEDSSNLDELAHSQNVKLMSDVTSLFGTWPDQSNDGFEQEVEELRHPKRKNK